MFTPKEKEKHYSSTDYRYLILRYFVKIVEKSKEKDEEKWQSADEITNGLSKMLNRRTLRKGDIKNYLEDWVKIGYIMKKNEIRGMVVYPKYKISDGGKTFYYRNWRVILFCTESLKI